MKNSYEQLSHWKFCWILRWEHGRQNVIRSMQIFSESCGFIDPIMLLRRVTGHPFACSRHDATIAVVGVKMRFFFCVNSVNFKFIRGFDARSSGRLVAEWWGLTAKMIRKSLFDSTHTARERAEICLIWSSSSEYSTLAAALLHCFHHHHHHHRMLSCNNKSSKNYRADILQSISLKLKNLLHSTGRRGSSSSSSKKKFIRFVPVRWLSAGERSLK